MADAPLEQLFEFFYDGDGNRVWGRAFRCISDGPFVLQPEEVEDGFFLDPAAVLKRAESEPFTPDGVMVLKRYMGSTE